MNLSYRFLGRLTLTTGLLKSQKRYTGRGEDYNPPPGYWKNRTNGIVPDEIFGQCAVLEIPLTVQYDVRQRENDRIFISAGLSSYRMLNESYEYTFYQPNDGAAHSWSSTQGNSYLLSVGHLSAGYERRIGNRFSLGIEPYLKAPFKGIGWTNIELFTYGAYLNVRYTFLKKLKS